MIHINNIFLKIIVSIQMFYFQHRDTHWQWTDNRQLQWYRFLLEWPGDNRLNLLFVTWCYHRYVVV